MASFHDDTIKRDGFKYAYGRFHAEPEHMERVDTASLRRMFLPKLTPDGRKVLRDDFGNNFVRGQLKHYGVHFDESEISGNGTLLMKKMLQAGKCDKVPDHISQLREQMHTEWLSKLTPEKLSDHPEWVIERYFMSSGRIDQTKTTAVVGIPYFQNSSPYSSQNTSYVRKRMHEAVNKVTGLHQMTGRGPKTHTIFMGWDPVAVYNAANSHAAKETKEVQAAEKEREDERVNLHTDCLNTLKRKKGPMRLRRYSPIGSYIIDCEEIEKGFPDDAGDLILDIRQTKEPDVFEASFNFRILEGVMIISADNNTLEQYCSQLDREAESASQEDDSDEMGDSSEDEDEDREDSEVEDEVENDRKPTTGSKRGAKTVKGPLTKRSKARATQPRTYLLRLKCRETGEGVIQPDPQRGTIDFKDEFLATFTGRANLPFVSNKVLFTARKISTSPAGSRYSWAQYSESAYEYARVNRWR